MKKTYQHLSAEDRAAIMIEHQRGASIREIARRLGRSASTVSRELARNRSTAMPRYDATQAASAYRLRRQRCVRRRKLSEGSALYWHVHHQLVFGTGRRSKLLPDSATCTQTIPTNVFATKRSMRRFTPIPEVGSSRR